MRLPGVSCDVYRVTCGCDHFKPEQEATVAAKLQLYAIQANGSRATEAGTEGPLVVAAVEACRPGPAVAIRSPSVAIISHRQR